ncbi:hypothetical protein [Siminovitchia fordii]|uniref:hypothetical protein n=1 Tax=Siminovitchia fordii TaxID=254759 RepID=UPI00316AE548
MVGTRGFTSTFQKFDMKQDGTWQFIMYAPNGGDYSNTNVFVEDVKPEWIVIKHTVFPHFLAGVNFENRLVRPNSLIAQFLKKRPLYSIR